MSNANSRSAEARLVGGDDRHRAGEHPQLEPRERMSR
jgi:hypothetical protein